MDELVVNALAEAKLFREKADSLTGEQQRAPARTDVGEPGEVVDEPQQFRQQIPLLQAPGGLLSIDLRGWEEATKRFLGQLDSIFTQASEWSVGGRLGAWFVAVTAAAVAVELARRKVTRSSGGPDDFLWVHHG
jgi:hypothetical protein